VEKHLLQLFANLKLALKQALVQKKLMAYFYSPVTGNISG